MRGYVTDLATDTTLAFGAREPTVMLGQNPAQSVSEHARTTITAHRGVRSDGYERKFGLSERRRELIRKKLSA